MKSERWLAALAASSLVLSGCLGRPSQPVFMALPYPEAHQQSVPGTAGPVGNSDLTWRAHEEQNYGRKDSARRLYRRALRECPGDDEAKAGMARNLYDLGYYADASELTQQVMANGGCHTPYASQLEVAMQSGSGNYCEARDAAASLGAWAQKNHQPLQAVDSYLTASRISAYNLNDGPGTHRYLAAAKDAARGGDVEAHRRIADYERSLKRDCMFAKLNLSQL